MVQLEQIRTVLILLEQNRKPTMLEEFKGYSPFQLLVSTLLSSRTKDLTTIPIAQKLFEDYKTPQDFIEISQLLLEQKLYGIGFYKTKAKHIKELSRILVERYNGAVPKTMGELILLPGVGVKTASCLLSYTFNLPAIAVDTHVHRISNRLGWIKTATPTESQKALEKLIPKELWNQINPVLVSHGQGICKPIGPQCGLCAVLKYCEFGKKRVL